MRMVVVNLDGLLDRPTDAARLIAELSRRSEIPVVATRRTPISPDFFVEPARRSVPDLARSISAGKNLTRPHSKTLSVS